MIVKIASTICIFFLFCVSPYDREKVYYSISGIIAKGKIVKKICVDYEIIGEKFNDCVAVVKNRFTLKNQIVQPAAATISTDMDTIKPLKVFLGNTDLTLNIADEINFISKPKLQTEFEKLKTKNFEIISVSIDEDKNAWLNAVKTDKLNWINLLDKKGQAGEIAVKFGVQAVPANFLLNPRGVIIGKNLNVEELEKVSNDLIK